MQVRKSERYKDPGVLIGVRSICSYTRTSPHTFYQWVEHHGFPATRLPGGRWGTTKSLIDDWIVDLRNAQQAEIQRGNSDHE